MLNGEQFTLFWYIDDNKVSYVEDKVNEYTVVDLLKKFGELIIQRGKKFNLIGMDIRITDEKNLKIGMK